MIADIFQALQIVRAKRKKQKAIDILVKSSLNYGIIQDLVNSATNGAKAVLTLKTGETIEFMPVDPFDKEVRTRKEYW